MSHENLDGIYSLPAAADYSATPWRFLVVNTSSQLALCGLGARPDAVLHNAPVSGAQARGVYIRGAVVKITVGAGGLTAGSKVFSDANGKAVNSATTGQIAAGRAIKAAAAGDIASIIFDPGLAINP